VGEQTMTSVVGPQPEVNLAELEKLVAELALVGDRLPDAFRMTFKGCAQVWRAADPKVIPAPFCPPLAHVKIICDDSLPEGTVLARIEGRWEIFVWPQPGEGKRDG